MLEFVAFTLEVGLVPQSAAELFREWGRGQVMARSPDPGEFPPNAVRLIARKAHGGGGGRHGVGWEDSGAVAEAFKQAVVRPAGVQVCRTRPRPRRDRGIRGVPWRDQRIPQVKPRRPGAASVGAPPPFPPNTPKSDCGR